MRFRLLAAAVAAMLLWSVPCEAGLPYYNQNLGYTIWLPDAWAEADDAVLARFSPLRGAVAPTAGEWEAGYVLDRPTPVCLLVSRLQGRVVSKDGIGNFNRFVVGGLMRGHGIPPGHRLRKAQFCEHRNTLRLELDGTDEAGREVVAVVYIVYTSTGMLRFVGLVPPGDAPGLRAVDEAVSTLYLDHGLRQP
jgi:hypothetical protein